MDELSNKSTSTSLSNIASTLTDSKTAWTERYRGLANLSYLTRREDFHVAFAENKSELGQGISRSLKSLRSEIVREASFAVASIVRRCMDKKFSERIMDVLLERPQSNSVMRRFQMHAGQIICNQIFSTHILSEIEGVLHKRKSKYQVVPAVSYLYVIAMTCGTEKIQKHSPLFIKALKSGMVCFNGATRRYSVACAMKIRDRVNEDVWGTIEAALSERQKRMMRSFEEADVPHLMLNVTKEKQDHKMREARVDRKKKALRKIRTSPFELPAIDINISALRTKFEYVDANKDGKVSQSELANVLQESGLKTRVARIRAANFFKIADSNNSGFVDADEFVVEYIRMQMLCVIRQIHRHFRKIDKNDDGELSVEEFKSFLITRIKDKTMVNDLCTRIFQSIDRDQSGGITIDEVEDWYVREEDSIYEGRLIAASLLKKRMNRLKRVRRHFGTNAKALLKLTAGRPKPISNEASVVVICGPSGVGKGTILATLKKKYPNMFAVAVSHTTREPRSGEIDGKDYHFVDSGTFEEMSIHGEFLEFASVHGKLYGTSKAAVNEVCERGSVCILEIDVQGAQAIKDSGTKARFLFITSSGGLEELEKRLRGRGTESEERIQKRLKTSAKELRFLKEREEFFDKVLVNDDLQVATEELLEAFSKWFPRLDKSSNL